MIDFLLFINVDLPANTKAFLAIFDQNVLKLLPNPLEINEDKIQCTPHKVSWYKINFLGFLGRRNVLFYDQFYRYLDSPNIDCLVFKVASRLLHQDDRARLHQKQKR